VALVKPAEFQRSEVIVLNPSSAASNPVQKNGPVSLSLGSLSLSCAKRSNRYLDGDPWNVGV